MAKKSEQFCYYDAVPGKRAEHVVFSPYPLGGNAYNSSARLQALAECSGFDVVTAHAAGTGVPYVPSKLRKDLRCVFKIGNLARAQGEALMADSRFADYEGYKVAQGLSARGMWIGAMVAYLDDAGKRPFTHVQTCDSINFSAPEPSITALRRLLKKTAERTTQEGWDLIQQTERKRSSEFFARACAIGEIAAYIDITCGGDGNRSPHRWLASRPNIPYHCVTFKDGVGGAQSDSIETFYGYLSYLREASGTADAPTAPLLTEVLPFKHGDLMNPQLVAGFLERTVQMTDPDFRIPTQ